MSPSELLKLPPPWQLPAAYIFPRDVKVVGSIAREYANLYGLTFIVLMPQQYDVYIICEEAFAMHLASTGMFDRVYIANPRKDGE